EFSLQGKLKKVRGRDNEAIIKSIIEDSTNIFRGGYSKPDPLSLLIVQSLINNRLIFDIYSSQAQWFLKYTIRKEEYDDEAKLYIVRKWMKLNQGQFD
ncbi:hypothetical protein PMAYCL1PPCAC_20428, partial [Pristionchus mayeri]